MSRHGMSHRGVRIVAVALVVTALAMAGVVSWLALGERGSDRQAEPSAETTPAPSGRPSSPLPEERVTPVTEAPELAWRWQPEGLRLSSSQVRGEVALIGYDRPERGIVRLGDDGSETWRQPGRDLVAYIAPSGQRAYTIDDWYAVGFSVLDTATGETLWQRDDVALSHVVDDLVLAGSSPYPSMNTRATMFDADGRILWQSRGFHIGLENHVYRVRGTRLAKVDPATGEAEWEIYTGLGKSLRAQVATGLVVLRGRTEVAGFDAEFGKELWRQEHDGGSFDLEPFGRHHVALSGNDDFSHDGAVTVVSRDGVVLRTHVASSEQQAPVWGRSIPHDGRDYVLAEKVLYDDHLEVVLSSRRRLSSAGSGVYRLAHEQFSYLTLDDGEEVWVRHTPDGRHAKDIHARDGSLLVVTRREVHSWR